MELTIWQYAAATIFLVAFAAGIIIGITMDRWAHGTTRIRRRTLKHQNRR